MDTKQKNREGEARRRTAPPAEQAPRSKKAPRSAAPVAEEKKPRKAEQQRAPEQKERRPRPAAQQEQPEVQQVRKTHAATQQKRRKPSGELPVGTPQEQHHPSTHRGIQLGGPHMHAARQRTPQEQRAAAKPLNTGSGSKKERTLKKNSLQNFISGIKGEEAKALSREEKSRERQKQRAALEAKRRRQAQRDNTPAVIYTQPAAFNRNRLFIQLLTVTAVVMALILALSVFFKVQVITISGAEVYSPWAVREASGIEEGDNLLTFSRARAGAQIRAALPYVDKVRIGIKLPETVIIYIEELSVAYAIKSSDGDWWLINSDGRIVEQVDGVTASNYTQVLGVTISNPEINEDAIATENAPTETDASGEPVPVLVTGAQRLFSALQILKALEANDVVGQAASVDVSLLESVVLWYGTRYQVNLGDTNRMEYKIACMNDTILQLSDYQSGILDISFTIWPNQVGYTPFS